MSELAESQNITPFLNPDYWSGHTLGYGDGPPAVCDEFELGDSLFAVATMKKIVAKSVMPPLHTFYIGDVFDPTNHHPGTTVLYHEEILSGASISYDYSVEELAAQAVPFRPTDTYPSFGLAVPMINIREEGREYLSTVRWGVVPQAEDGYIVSAAAQGLNQNRIGITACPLFMKTQAPIEVGQTTHYQETKFLPEQLRRVSILHIIANGSPEKQTRKARRVLPRLAFGGSFA